METNASIRSHLIIEELQRNTQRVSLLVWEKRTRIERRKDGKDG